MKALLTITAMLLLTISGLAQERTLRAIVEEEGGPVNLQTNANPAPISLAELARQVDLIVRGSVAGTVSYLSPSGTDIYTDLTLTNVQFIYPAAAALTKQPGPPPPLVVTQLGGTVSINGHQVRSTHQNLPPLQSGIDALFLLVRDTDKLFIAARYFGAFAIENNRVVPLTRAEWFAAQHRGRSADDFVREVVAIATARGR